MRQTPNVVNSFVFGASGLVVCPKCRNIFRPRSEASFNKAGYWIDNNGQCEPCIKELLGAIKNKTLEIKV